MGRRNEKTKVPLWDLASISSGKKGFTLRILESAKIRVTSANKIPVSADAVVTKEPLKGEKKEKDFFEPKAEDFLSPKLTNSLI